MLCLCKIWCKFFGSSTHSKIKCHFRWILATFTQKTNLYICLNFYELAAFLMTVCFLYKILSNCTFASRFDKNKPYLLWALKSSPNMLRFTSSTRLSATKFQQQAICVLKFVILNEILGPSHHLVLTLEPLMMVMFGNKRQIGFVMRIKRWLSTKTIKFSCKNDE